MGPSPPRPCHCDFQVQFSVGLGPAERVTWTKATMILVAVLGSESPVLIPRPGGGSGFAGLGLQDPAFVVSDSDEPNARLSHGHGHRDSGFQ